MNFNWLKNLSLQKAVLYFFIFILIFILVLTLVF